MAKVSRKDIQLSIEGALQQTLLKLDLPEPSKKIEKLVDNFSRKFSVKVKDAIKKNDKAKKRAKPESTLKKTKA
ncbi:Sec7 domain-containing protein [Ohtaekwangia koreensis]|nr:Sec7 domain-containing protein [Ohtaekwangia koreensis]